MTLGRVGSHCVLRCALFSFSFALLTEASAAPKDAAAKAADQHAMNDLFIAAHFDDAKDALTGALDDCKKGCSKRVRALLHRDLGVVELTGLNDSGAARSEFTVARSLDPKITLDPALTTPEVQAAFDAAGAAAAASQDVTLEEDQSEAKPDEASPSSEEPGVEPECSNDSDCSGGRACASGHCAEKPEAPGAPSVWLSAGLSQDFLSGSGSDVCTEASQLSHFTCLRASGSQYHGTPLPGSGGNLSLFPAALAGTRVTLATYFPLADKWSAGLRFGYAFLGQGPHPDGGKAYFPFQIEVEGAYWLSAHAFSTDAIGTFLDVSTGAAEVDGKGSVTVHENPNVPPPPNQIDNPSQQTLDAYLKAGDAFLGIGGGLFLPFGRRAGLLVDLRLSAFFPAPGFGASLGIQGALGL